MNFLRMLFFTTAFFITAEVGATSYNIDLNIDGGGLSSGKIDLSAGGNEYNITGSVGDSAYLTIKFDTLTGNAAKFEIDGLIIHPYVFEHVAGTPIYSLSALFEVGDSFTLIGFKDVEGTLVEFEGVDQGKYKASLSTVPLPAAAWLFGTALIGLVSFSRRKEVV